MFLERGIIYWYYFCIDFINKTYANIFIVLLASILSYSTLSQARDCDFYQRGIYSLNESKEEPVVEESVENNTEVTTEVIIENDKSVSNLIKAVVYIEIGGCPGDGLGEWVASGSGSIIDRRGLILTNYHVIDECTGQILIGITESPDRDPDIRYIAEIAAYDKDLDIAVLNIIKFYKDRSSFSGDNLSYLTIGDSDNATLGDDINVWGYPGSRRDASGQTRLNLSKGTVSGIDSYKGYKRGWIISDVNITWGNSGGAALNSDNELIGIPTEGRGVGSGGGILGALRPINIALETIESARRITGKK